MRNVVAVGLLAGLAACAAETSGGIEDGTNDTFLAADGKDDTGIVTEGTPEALAVLRLVNEATESELTGAVGLSQQVSHNIVAHRAGTDGVIGTADDERFATLLQLDAVDNVGASVFNALLSYARDLGYVVETVNIRLTGALIAPFMAYGDQWDGPGGAASPQDISALASALGVPDPFSGVLALVTGILSVAYEKPDPTAWAGLEYGGSPRGVLDLATASSNQEDTLTPTWSGQFSAVPLDSTLHIYIHLTDEDLVNDDPIGVAAISYRDVVAALESGAVYQVDVSRQTNNQVLFIGIAASLQHSSNPAPPTCHVTFQSEGPSWTSPGQDVWITGNQPQLGAWSATAGLKLSGTGTWTGSVDLPQGLMLEYKAAVVTAANGVVAWEPGQNHKVTIPTGPSCATTIITSWR